MWLQHLCPTAGDGDDMAKITRFLPCCGGGSNNNNKEALSTR